MWFSDPSAVRVLKQRPPKNHFGKKWRYYLCWPQLGSKFLATVAETRARDLDLVTRQDRLLYVPQSRTEMGRRRFECRGPTLYNALPPDLLRLPPHLFGRRPRRNLCAGREALTWCAWLRNWMGRLILSAFDFSVMWMRVCFIPLCETAHAWMCMCATASVSYFEC